MNIYKLNSSMEVTVQERAAKKGSLFAVPPGCVSYYDVVRWTVDNNPKLGEMAYCDVATKNPQTGEKLWWEINNTRYGTEGCFRNLQTEAACRYLLDRYTFLRGDNSSGLGVDLEGLKVQYLNGKGILDDTFACFTEDVDKHINGEYPLGYDEYITDIEQECVWKEWNDGLWEEFRDMLAKIAEEAGNDKLADETRRILDKQYFWDALQDLRSAADVDFEVDNDGEVTLPMDACLDLLFIKDDEFFFTGKDWPDDQPSFWTRTDGHAPLADCETYRTIKDMPLFTVQPIAIRRKRTKKKSPPKLSVLPALLSVCKNPVNNFQLT